MPDNRQITLRISDIGGHELGGNMLDKYLFAADVMNIL